MWSTFSSTGSNHAVWVLGLLLKLQCKTAQAFTLFYTLSINRNNTMWHSFFTLNFCVLIYLYTHTNNHLFSSVSACSSSGFLYGNWSQGKKDVEVENVDMKTAVKIKLLKLFHLYQKGLDFCCALIFLPKQLLHFLGFLK